MQLIARSTVEGNDAILNLSIQSVKESKSMKVITIMALIYAPASFTAVSSIFISLRSQGQDMVTVLAFNSALEMIAVVSLDRAPTTRLVWRRVIILRAVNTCCIPSLKCR